MSLRTGEQTDTYFKILYFLEITRICEFVGGEGILIVQFYFIIMQFFSGEIRQIIQWQILDFPDGEGRGGANPKRRMKIYYLAKFLPKTA